MSMNLSKYYGKNINPSCAYCLYCSTEGKKLKCDKEQDTASASTCRMFRYEPTMREPKTLPPLTGFKPEDFQI